MTLLSKNEKELLISVSTNDMDCIDNKQLQHAYLLQEKGLVTIEKIENETLSLTPEGEHYLTNGFPEERLLDVCCNSISIDDARALLGDSYNIAISNALKQKLVYISDKVIYKVV